LVDYYSTVAWGILTRPQVGDFQVAIRGGELKMLLAMRLEAEGPPNAMHRGPGNLGLSRQRPASPMSAVLGLGFQGLSNEAGHLFITDGPRTARFGFIVKSNKTLAQKALTPFAHGGT
jgi:hypothetical protein